MIKSNDLENKYTVYISKSPKEDKKFQCVVYSSTHKKTLHFGSSNHSDYTLHRTPKRMLKYIQRHGAKNFKEMLKKHFNVTAVKDVPDDITNKDVLDFNNLDQSHKEDWQNPFTAGFWSRWYIWSYDNIPEAEKFISETFNIKFN